MKLLDAQNFFSAAHDSNCGIWSCVYVCIKVGWKKEKS